MARTLTSSVLRDVVTSWKVYLSGYRETPTARDDDRDAVALADVEMLE